MGKFKIDKALKPQRGLGDPVTRHRRKVRDRLRREEAQYEQMVANQARDEMVRAKEANYRSEMQRRQNYITTLRNAAAEQAVAVARSRSLEQDVRMNTSSYNRSISAWTDFNTVNVTWPWVPEQRAINARATFVWAASGARCIKVSPSSTMLRSR